jgi:glycolate oxidase FAD binding subunit
LAADLRGLNNVIDYPARDMTITVQAGITLERLGSVLRAEKQRLPVDVPRADVATLGGALAVNVSGPRRFAFGTFRDYVIGVSMVNDEGHEIKAGGRVVKNVAGYDICKLAVGSLGTLGIITQVTLKLRPTPEEQALVAVACAADPEPVLERMHRTSTRPVSLELLNAAAVRCLNRRLRSESLEEADWSIVIGFEDNAEATSWQVQQLIRELPDGTRRVDVRLSSSAEPLWRELIELFADTPFVFKASLRPTAVAAFCLQVRGLLPDIAIQSHAGSGIVLGAGDEGLTLEKAAPALATLREAAVVAQGNLVILRCPAAWKKTLPIWGAPRGDLALMHAVKNKLDPQRIFNPGRFVDGI